MRQHLVWRAWTTPELVKRWWHANRGAMIVCEIDLRVGGMWRYVMVADGGLEVGFHGEYREIVPSERLVSTEVYEGIPDAEEHAAIDILTLTEVGERTILTILVERPRRAGTPTSTPGWRQACRTRWTSWSRSRARFASKRRTHGPPGRGPGGPVGWT